jgi:hypothetical protein
MSDPQQARVKEQAEAHLRQLRTIPYSNALPLMEDLLSELYKLRDIYCYEHDSPMNKEQHCKCKGCSCHKHD